MTDNYTRFTIAMWFSLVLHEVGFFLSPRFLMLRKLFLQLVYFGLCAPGFLAQFLPFMQRYKVQQVGVFVREKRVGG